MAAAMATSARSSSATFLVFCTQYLSSRTGRAILTVEEERLVQPGELPRLHQDVARVPVQERHDRLVDVAELPAPAPVLRVLGHDVAGLVVDPHEPRRVEVGRQADLLNPRIERPLP